MENSDKCIICGSNDFELFLKCRDYFLSQEEFNIMKCKNCGHKFTYPVPANIDKYYESDKYISHSDSKKGLVDFLFQLVKNYTLPRKFLLVNKYSKGKKILDIGCGTGDFLNLFNKKGWETHGIEPNEKARNFANSKHNLLNIKDDNYIKCIENEYFDVITMWHVLEHVPSVNEKLDDIKRILKTDGILIIAVPNADSFDAKIYSEFWAGYDIPRHLYHFTINTIDKLLAKHRFSISKIIPMKFDSYYISLLSEKYKNHKTNFFKALCNGLRSNIYALKNDNNYSSLIFIIKKS